jgi:hypothetical protein
MFMAWLSTSLLLCNAFLAYLRSPSLKQLQKKYEIAKDIYQKRKSVRSEISAFLNSAYYKMIMHRDIIASALFSLWVIFTLLWIHL